jgi:poly-gamma-glutamate capsule biosynthesis protein CapA/YwtB (metallophosphatase superfamily)
MSSRTPRAGVESRRRGPRSARWVRLVLVLVLVSCREPSRPPGPARLWLGGDLHLGTSGASVEARLAALARVTGGASGIVNLEGPVVDDGADVPRGRLGNGAGLVAGLARAGIRVAGVANNHAGDHGPAGAARTIGSLRAAGVTPVGGEAGPAIIDAGGTRVAVVQHDLAHGVPAGSPAGLAAELGVARLLGDLLVVTFHVTGPPSYLPPPELRTAVDEAVAAGADVIAAHGSHALGAVERRGRAVIAWGLGNLLFHCDCTDERDGALLLIHLDEGRLRAAAIVPIDAGLGGSAATPAADPMLTFELLASLRSSRLEPAGDRAWIFR